MGRSAGMTTLTMGRIQLALGALGLLSVLVAGATGYRLPATTMVVHLVWALIGVLLRVLALAWIAVFVLATGRAVSAALPAERTLQRRAARLRAGSSLAGGAALASTIAVFVQGTWVYGGGANAARHGQLFALAAACGAAALLANGVILHRYDRIVAAGRSAAAEAAGVDGG